jgi:hypothetical protein
VDVADLHHLATGMTVVIEGANQIGLQFEQPDCIAAVRSGLP